MVDAGVSVVLAVVDTEFLVVVVRLAVTSPLVAGTLRGGTGKSGVGVFTVVSSRARIVDRLTVGLNRRVDDINGLLLGSRSGLCGGPGGVRIGLPTAATVVITPRHAEERIWMGSGVADTSAWTANYLAKIEKRGGKRGYRRNRDKYWCWKVWMDDCSPQMRAMVVVMMMMMIMMMMIMMMMMMTIEEDWIAPMEAEEKVDRRKGG